MSATAAEQLVEKPDQELSDVLAELPTLSAASESEARWDKELADGSTVVVRSRDGGECRVTALAPGEQLITP